MSLLFRKKRYLIRFCHMNISYCQSVIVKRILTLSLLTMAAYIYYHFSDEKTTFDVMDETLPEWIYYSAEEVKFPIAYAINVDQDYDQFHRLFGIIYRPFNVYCIHVDLKSSKTLIDSVLNLTKEYKNVILPKISVDLNYNSFSKLKSELVCMEALFEYKSVEWKYLINLDGQEWPLKVNLEIVRILRELKGANLVEKMNPNRERFPSRIGPPPYKIRPWKGAVHVIVSRGFVKFALYDKRSIDFLKYLQDTDIPEETFFSTLNHDHRLRVPGGYSGDLLRNEVTYPFLNRHKIWETEGKCYGKFIRSVCIFAMADVPAMTTDDNKKFFAHKFIKGVNDDVLNVMERWIYNRSRVVYANRSLNPFINLAYYRQLTVVNNHY